MSGLIVSDPTCSADDREHLARLLHDHDLPLLGFTQDPAPLFPPDLTLPDFLRVASAAPSCAARIRFLQKLLPTLENEQQLKEFLYDVLGTTQESCDCCAAAFALFMWAKDDVHLAIRLATEMGGDTDTIACLAAGLCALYAGKHNLPDDMVKLVSEANHLDFDALADMVLAARPDWKGEND